MARTEGCITLRTTAATGPTVQAARKAPSTIKTSCADAVVVKPQPGAAKAKMSVAIEAKVSAVTA